MKGVYSIFQKSLCQNPTPKLYCSELQKYFGHFAYGIFIFYLLVDVLITPLVIQP